jgi:hypothetical protein
MSGHSQNPRLLPSASAIRDAVNASGWRIVAKPETIPVPCGSSSWHMGQMALRSAFHASDSDVEICSAHLRRVAIKKPHVHRRTSGLENPELRTRSRPGNKLIFVSREMTPHRIAAALRSFRNTTLVAGPRYNCVPVASILTHTSPEKRISPLSCSKHGATNARIRIRPGNQLVARTQITACKHHRSAPFPPTPWSRIWGAETNFVATQSFEWCFNRMILAQSRHSGVNVSPRMAVPHGAAATVCDKTEPPILRCLMKPLQAAPWPLLLVSHGGLRLSRPISRRLPPPPGCTRCRPRHHGPRDRQR